MLTTFWNPVVAVPARNEEMRLPALIGALSAQSWLLNARRRLPVTIVLNNCSDGSADVVKDAQRRHANLQLQVIVVDLPNVAAHVGTARRLALDAALEAQTAPGASVLLTTDADAEPERGWIDATLRAVTAGADLVGGQIIGNPQEEGLLGAAFRHRADQHLRYATLADQLASLLDPLPHDPWPRHHDHTGASLAVRGDVYSALGGLPALPFREDLAFVSLARAAGYRLRHPLDVRVQVSARLVGRAPGGMADCLRGWIRDAEEGLPVLVENPELILRRLRTRGQIRGGHASGVDLTIDSETGGIGAPLRAEALIERWAADDPDALGDTPVETAIARVQQMICEAETYAAAA